MREVAAEFERPALLFSGGKDSIVMLRLAEKAFWPARLPFPLVHVDTGHNFDEVLAFRDRRAAELSARLVVAKVQDDIDAGRVGRGAGRACATRCRPRRCCAPSRRAATTPSSAGPGATRRRPARRSASSPSATPSASGTRRTSAPSCGTSTTAGTTRASTSASSRCRNWTELDVWRYIAREGIEVPSLYYAHEREVFERDGMLLGVTPFSEPRDGETGEHPHRPLPHGRRRVLHRRGRLARPRTPAEVVDEVASTRHHRARRHPRRRPRQRGRHGGPQEGGVLLA